MRLGTPRPFCSIPLAGTIRRPGASGPIAHAGPRELGETYSEQSSLLVVDGREADLRVDVEEAFLPARRPDSRLNAELVGLEVVVIVRAVEGEGA